MLKSMTAYARVSVKKRVGRFSLELQSVNRKFLEIQTFLPHELARFDVAIKKQIGNLIGRGQINARLFVEFEEDALYVVKPNLPLVRQLKNAFSSICDELNISQELKADALLFQKGILLHEEELPNEAEYLEALEEVLSKALSQLIAMKEKEGLSLSKDIETRLETLTGVLKEIEHLASHTEKKLREKLVAKLAEALPLLSGNAFNLHAHDERILREVCLFAEKADIAEEITRFKSHLEQFSGFLKSSCPIGKTLEFLLQEMNREVNTIGSKASDIQITKHVIEMKSGLERIREQMQNVE